MNTQIRRVQDKNYGSSSEFPSELPSFCAKICSYQKPQVPTLDEGSSLKSNIQNQFRPPMLIYGSIIKSDTLHSFTSSALPSDQTRHPFLSFDGNHIHKVRISNSLLYIL